MQDFYFKTKICSQGQGQGQDFDIQGQGQDLKFCPRGYPRPRTSRKDYKIASRERSEPFVRKHGYRIFHAIGDSLNCKQAVTFHPALIIKPKTHCWPLKRLNLRQNTQRMQDSETFSVGVTPSPAGGPVDFPSLSLSPTLKKILLTALNYCRWFPYHYFSYPSIPHPSKVV